MAEYDSFEAYYRVKWQYGPMAPKLSWPIDAQGFAIEFDFHT